MGKPARLLGGLALVGAVAAGLAVAARQGSPSPPSAPQAQQAQMPGASSKTPLLELPAFRDIAHAATPMVVNIRTESRQETRQLNDFFGRDLLERFFGGPDAPVDPRGPVTEGAGTGFIIGADGLILTNNHVVAGASRITVGLYAREEEEYDARVVGRDPLTDSALIRLTSSPGGQLPVARLGNSRDIRAGDWVMAIGNPFNLAHTVTVGVISATGRPFPMSEGRWQQVLQTDAAINPGNSGGPLLNLNGEVIGINTAILSGGMAGGNVGVGFAVPIDTVRELLPQLQQGTVTRGRIGVQVTPVTKALTGALGLDRPRGALVRVVDRTGPAATAGIAPGDVIVGYDRTPIEKSDELVQAVSRTKPGATVPVEVVRDGKSRTVNVTIATLEPGPDERAGQDGSPAEKRFGVALGNLTPELRSKLALPGQRSGAVVTSVEPSSVAARAGVRPGDVILEVNRKPVSSANETAAALRGVGEKEVATMLVWRVGQEVFLTLQPRG